MADIIASIVLDNMYLLPCNLYSFVLIHFDLAILMLEVETIFQDYNISNIQVDNLANCTFSMNLTMSNTVFILFLIVDFRFRVILCIIFILIR
jgi:hypothetical protein